MIEKYGKETLDRHTAETNRRAKKGQKFAIGYVAAMAAVPIAGITLASIGMGSVSKGVEAISPSYKKPW